MHFRSYLYYFDNNTKSTLLQEIKQKHVHKTDGTAALKRNGPLTYTSIYLHLTILRLHGRRPDIVGLILIFRFHFLRHTVEFVLVTLLLLLFLLLFVHVHHHLGVSMC